MNDHQIIDRNGNRVTRNGVLADGDRLVVPLRLMDAADPALVAAAALADAVKRNEQFDALRGHRPGFIAHDAPTSATIDKALTDRDARLTNAWRQPAVEDTTIKAPLNAPTIDPSAGKDALFAARDQAVAARDQRTEQAWKSS